MNKCWYWSLTERFLSRQRLHLFSLHNVFTDDGRVTTSISFTACEKFRKFRLFFSISVNSDWVLQCWSMKKCIIFETNVLVIYVCFQIDFLVDHHCKTQSELSDLLEIFKFFYYWICCRVFRLLLRQLFECVLRNMKSPLNIICLNVDRLHQICLCM